MNDDEKRDRELGLHEGIGRRDFLQGLALSLGAAPLVAAGAASAESSAAYYPPVLNGLRGSHPGSFETAHAMLGGDGLPKSTDTFERYDLVVVGGGISGLSAAHFYLEHSPTARILILENHDDFGGHARRNEFWLNGRMHLMNGGTWSIESPTPYSAVADGLLKSLDIDRDQLAPRLEDKKFYSSQGLSSAVFFDRETFGADYLMLQREGVAAGEFLARAPLSAAAKRGIEAIEGQRIDHLPGLTSEEKKLRLASISYQQFLLTLVGADAGVCDYYRSMTHGLWGVGIDAVSALDCWGVGLPGFQGMGLKPGSIPRMGYTPAGVADHGWTPTVHFPDGNATVARSLVRRLVPAAVPGAGLEDLVTAKVDYTKLDRSGSAVRIRLKSTGVRAANLRSGGSPAGVGITYVRDGAAFRVRARHCVLACWNMFIPYLCPELPEHQKSALRGTSKVPLVYTSVALRNWTAFKSLGVSQIRAPGSYYSSLKLNEVTRIGEYRSSLDPEEPIVAHVIRTPCSPSLPEREQNKVGRAEIMETSFETYERKLRDQLGRMLGPGGFDPARDIVAITVNRWPHGYAHEYNPLFDAFLPETERPHVIGRARCGHIAIANADAASAAYTDAAIDQAYRAVHDLKSA
jgi:spermidine dehydrogenase